jgi:transcription elongation factor Elf1
MSFTIICNECNSTNVAVDGDMECIAIVTCKECGHSQYGDQFPYAD